MRSRRALALALAATALGSGPAPAAEPPTILTAGIDAADHLYVTWSLAAGTTYADASFASGPWPEPGAPFAFFAGNATGGDDCVPPSGVTDGPCKASPTATSFTTPEPTARDRRYFVKVAAVPTGGPPRVTSAVWVIDEARPLMPGFVPAAEGPPTNSPATGRSLAGMAFPAVPHPTISVPALPTTIRALLVTGVRVRVRCATFQCALEDGSLSLGGTSIASESDFVAAGRTHTFVLRPRGAARTRLRGRTRARLRLRALVRTADGRARRITRSFTVRR
ncbi:MAG: hypothetical protein QOJ35_3719 [Solirubrobacteraceae bacterium]|nr:hypothetical protein [Solirubrobacteraceae bacterium]